VVKTEQPSAKPPEAGGQIAATTRVHHFILQELYRHGGSLIELISLQQSRDDLVICRGSD
jgi:hypothetical protein